MDSLNDAKLLADYYLEQQRGYGISNYFDGSLYQKVIYLALT